MNFTVLMSLYIKENASYLNDCLKSLENQTMPANEIVIVLDGPISIELENVLFKWEQQLPIKKIPLEKNIGLGRALNIGLKHCSNEWVFRMDTDDICLPSRFEDQVEYIQKHPETVLLGGQIKEFSTTPTEDMFTREVPIGFKKIYNYAIKKNPFNHVTVAYKKSNILQLGGYQHHLFMEDYNLWLRVLANHKKVENLPNTLVLVRAGDAMLSRRRGKIYIKSEWEMFKLKKSLGYHGWTKGILLFVARAIPRILPPQLLTKIYRLQRKIE